ncbi:MAG TPA: glycosyltransferase family 39 protein [Vicinamibacteria bacterium]|nr:glycosyltransferase family 39 protein [Vicinamibacteria bacterium]
MTAWQLDGHPLLQPVGSLDSGVYVDLARHVAGGDVLLRTAAGGEPFFLAPLYVYFLGLVFAVTGGSLAAAKVVQVVLGTAAVALLYAASRPWVGRRAALVAAGLMALTGPVVFHEAILLQAALDPFLMALGLLAVSRALGRGSWLDWTVAGTAVALFALNRPNALLWGASLAVALPLGRGLARGLREAAALALGLALGLAPVTLRNLAVSGEPVLISSHGGLNLYIGNRADADGTYRHVPGITPDIRGQARDARRVAEEAAGRRLRAGEVDAYFSGLAWEWMRSRPLDAARLFLRKLAYVFAASEVGLNYSYAYYARDEPTLLGWLFVGPWLLLPLGLLGLADRLWAAPTDGPGLVGGRPGFALWALVVPAYAVSVAVFFVSSRYRLPVLVPLAAGAGFAIVRLLETARARDGRRLGTYAAVLAPLLVLAFWPHRLDDGRAEERTVMLLWLVDNGQAAEALRRLPPVEAAHPEPALLLFRVGQALDESREAAAGVPLLERSLALEPRPETHLALGQALLDTGRAPEAIPHLEASLAANVRPDLAGFGLVQALTAAGRPAEAAARLGGLSLPASADGASLLAAASAALQLRRPDLALRFLDRGVAADPGMAVLREKRGLAFATLGRRAEARADLEEARRLDPASASVCLNLAVLEAQDGRLDAARALAREALRLKPDYPHAQGLLAELERSH